MSDNDIRNDDAPERDEDLAALYRAGQRPAAPPHLDERILQAARDAVSDSPPPARAAAHRWQLPLSIAATLVLGVSVVTLMQREAPREFDLQPEMGDVLTAPSPPSPPSPPPAAQGQTAPSAAVPQPEVAAPAEMDAQAPAESPSPPGVRREERETKSLRPTAPRLSSPAPAADEEAALGDSPSPEQWLAEIRTLLEQGKQDEAARRLAEFKRQYPSFPQARMDALLGR